MVHTAGNHMCPLLQACNTSVFYLKDLAFHHAFHFWPVCLPAYVRSFDLMTHAAQGLLLARLCLCENVLRSTCACTCAGIAAILEECC